MNFRLDSSRGFTIGIAELTGRLDAQNSKELQKTFVSWLQKTRCLVLDCSAVDFIDSSGLGAIVGCLRKTLEAAGELKLAGLNAKVAMVFELTQAERLFSIFTNAGEAAASFAAAPDSQK
ncbi:MAG: STAS domain-containing protein [Chlorobiaceae bacterium]|nr:STAS domain-containing protein [Chlorobiaceae bacterium]